MVGFSPQPQATASADPWAAFPFAQDQPQTAMGNDPWAAFPFVSDDQKDAQERVKSEAGTLQNIDNAARSVARGVPLVGGAMDEISAGLNTGFGYASDYGKELAYQRERDRQYDEQHPILSHVGQFTGGILGTIAGARALPFNPVPATMPGKIAAGAGIGSAVGGEEAFTRGEGGFQNRAQAAKTGAVVGAGIGAAVPMVAGTIGRTFAGNATKQIAKSAPSEAEVYAAKQKAYGDLDKAGVNYSQPGFTTFAQDLSKNLTHQIDPELHHDSAHILSRIVDKATSPQSNGLSFNEFDHLRQIAGESARDFTLKEADRRFAGQIRNELDNYAGSAPLTTNGTIPAEAVPQVAARARELASRLIKTRMINRATATAESGGYLSGEESGYRNQMASILKNTSKRESLSPAEQQAVKQAVHGGGANQILGSAGRGGIGGARNFLGPIVAAHAGGAAIGSLLTPVLGPLAPFVGAATSVGAASVAKKLAERGTKAAAQRALQTALAGRDAQNTIMAARNAALSRNERMARALLTTQGAREAGILAQPSAAGR